MLERFRSEIAAVRRVNMTSRWSIGAGAHFMTLRWRWTGSASFLAQLESWLSGSMLRSLRPIKAFARHWRSTATSSSRAPCMSAAVHSRRGYGNPLRSRRQRNTLSPGGNGGWRRDAKSGCEPSRHRLLKKEIQMAKSNPRRTIIREWTSLVREERQSIQQAAAFAMAALQRHSLPRSRQAPRDVVMAWLRPRIGRA